MEKSYSPYKETNAVYEFHLTDEEDGKYQLEFLDKKATVHYTNEKAL